MLHKCSTSLYSLIESVRIMNTGSGKIHDQHGRSSYRVHYKERPTTTLCLPGVYSLHRNISHLIARSGEFFKIEPFYSLFEHKNRINLNEN